MSELNVPKQTELKFEEYWNSIKKNFCYEKQLQIKNLLRDAFSQGFLDGKDYEMLIASGKEELLKIEHEFGNLLLN